MTNREFYNALINANINDTPSKTQEANAPLYEQIVNSILTSEPKTASDVASELGVSVQKASALLRGLVADGKAVSSDVKVAKKGTQKAYTLAE